MKNRTPIQKFGNVCRKFDEAILSIPIDLPIQIIEYIKLHCKDIVL